MPGAREEGLAERRGALLLSHVAEDKERALGAPVDPERRGVEDDRDARISLGARREDVPVVRLDAGERGRPGARSGSGVASISSKQSACSCST